MQSPKAKYPKSELIKNVILDEKKIHKGDGDMWPITWADDDNLYAGAGDNCKSPMNIWKIVDSPEPFHAWFMHLECINNLPVDPEKYCQVPQVHNEKGVKPAGIIFLDGILYLAAELHNYGDNPSFNRQHNISAWIITSSDYGKTWDTEATKQKFFTGRLASPHFLQFGKNYEGARDEYVYAYFPTAEDGNSYWCNGDALLLGRVKKEVILDRNEWEFYSGIDLEGSQIWNKDDTMAVAVFEFPLMTGEDHVFYNKGL